MALAHPTGIEALIVQDAVATGRGPGRELKAAGAFWAIAPSTRARFETNLLSLATTRDAPCGNDPNVERYDPDLWTDEIRLSQPARPGRHPERPLLRLPDERRGVPSWQA